MRLGQGFGDGTAQATDDTVLLCRDQRPGLLGCLEQQLPVEWLEAVHLHQAGFDANPCQILGSLAQRPTIAPLATNVTSFPIRLVNPLPISSFIPAWWTGSAPPG